jgi:hypothetical protein
MINPSENLSETVSGGIGGTEKAKWRRKYEGIMA